MTRPCQRRRRGSAFVLVVAGLLVLGVMIGALFVSSKERDLAAHNLHADEGCRSLAQSAARVTVLAIRRALVPDSRVTEGAESKRLLHVLLQSDADLAARLKRLSDGYADQGRQLGELLGERFLEPVTLGLLPFYPGATVRVALRVDPEGLYADFYPAALPDEDEEKRRARTPDFLDPFERRLKLTVLAEARWGGVVRTEVLVKEARVNSLLPPLASRFVFFLDHVTSETLNARGNDQDGVTLPSERQQWMIMPKHVFAHDRKDGDAKELAQAATSGAAPETGKLSAAELVEEFSDRGFIYLGAPPAGATTTERTDVLLPSGTVSRSPGVRPGGADHNFANLSGPDVTALRAVRAPEQPPALEQLRPPDPASGATQEPFVQGLFRGFCQELRATDLFAASLPASFDTCPWLLFGTAERPVRTLVVGPVAVRCVRATDVAVDRDGSSNDESSQQAEAGVPTPLRETVDPFLRPVTEPVYAAELGVETTVPLDLTQLSPFCTRELVPLAKSQDEGRFGYLANLNRLVDADGDGLPERPLPCEESHDPVRVDLQLYRYGSIFKDYPEYCGVASTGAERFSFNLLARAMLAPPALAAGLLWPERVKEPATVVADGGPPRALRGMVGDDDLVLRWGDVRHAKGCGPMFDPGRDVATGLHDVPIRRMLERRAVARLDEQELRRRFMTNGKGGATGTIDLRGFTLQAPILYLGWEWDPGDNQWKRVQERYIVAKRHPFPNPMDPDQGQYQDGGGAVLCTGLRAQDSTILPSGDGARLTLGAAIAGFEQPFDLTAFVDAQGLELNQSFADKACRLAGGLHLPSSEVASPLGTIDVEYDQGWDPTAPDTPKHYRGHVGDATLWSGMQRQPLEAVWSAPTGAEEVP